MYRKQKLTPAKAGKHKPISPLDLPEVHNIKPMHGAFAIAYVRTGNGTQSAIEAGYSEATAVNQGSRLLRRDDVKAAILALRKAFSLDDSEQMSILSAMARGEIPTKTGWTSLKDGQRKEFADYDRVAALRLMQGADGGGKNQTVILANNVFAKL